MKKIMTISLAIVMTVAVLLFAGCTPSTSAKMKKRYEDKGYSVTVLAEEKDSLDAYAWSLTAMPESGSIIGAIGSIGKIVTVTCYNNKEDAQSAYDSLSNYDEDCKFISGKIVVCGFSKESVDIAR